MLLVCFFQAYVNNFSPTTIFPKTSQSISNFSCQTFLCKNFNSFLIKSKISSINSHKNIRKKHQKKWCAVFGPGGGFFGVGTSELVVIGIVAWIVLGPKRLYQLARDIGKISGEIKNVAEEAKQTFQQAIDLENLNENIIEDKKKIIQSASNKNEINPSVTTLKKSSIKELDELLNADLSVLEKKKND